MEVAVALGVGLGSRGGRRWRGDGAGQSPRAVKPGGLAWVKGRRRRRRGARVCLAAEAAAAAAAGGGGGSSTRAGSGAGAGSRVSAQPVRLRFQTMHFGMSVGICAQALMWTRLGAAFPGTVPPWLAPGLAGAGAAVLLASVALYASKAVAFPEAVRRELAHSVKGNFAVAPALALAFLSLASPWPCLARAGFCVAAAAQLAFGLLKYGAWVAGPASAGLRDGNPAHFFAIVLNLVVATLGMRPGVAEALAWAPSVSRFFLAVGAFHWAVVVANLYLREGRATGGAAPPRDLPVPLRPLLLLPMAPPMAASVAMLACHGPAAAPLAEALFFVGAFHFLLCVRLAPYIAGVVADDGTRRAPAWTMAYWASTFPTVACCLAALGLHLTPLAVAFAATATLAFTATLASTLRAAALGHMLPPDPDAADLADAHHAAAAVALGKAS